jgi:hypothetical protein
MGADRGRQSIRSIEEKGIVLLQLGTKKYLINHSICLFSYSESNIKFEESPPRH